MTYKEETKGIALVMSLSVLFILSVMAVSFVKITGIEHNASTNYADLSEARFMAYSGIEHAVLQLRQDFNGDVSKVPRSWLYQVPDNNYYYNTIKGWAQDANLDSDVSNDPDKIADDTTGACFPLELAGEEPEESNASISYKAGTRIKNRQVSGWMGEENQKTGIYSLKIFDTTSQINLNSHINADTPKDGDTSYENYMADLLNNLSKAIAMREPFRTERPGNSDGPLKGLGAQIMKKRRETPLGYFTSKFDIIGTYVGGNITGEDLKYLWDYLTVYPMPPEMKTRSVYKNIRPKGGSDEAYERQYRNPVNINTAGWPVLVALFWGLKSGSVEITEDEAKILANKICIRRRTSPFATWNDFIQFLVDQFKANGAFYDDVQDKLVANAEKKYAILKANFDPNVTLRWFNADAAVYQVLNKTDLTYYTTEISFFPLGNFEITSLGEILDSIGNPITSSQQYAVVRIHDTVYCSTQYDFEGGGGSILYASGTTPSLAKRQGNYVAEEEGYHAFSYPNNLQRNPYYGNQDELLGTSDTTGDASRHFGYLAPLVYNLTNGFGQMDGGTGREYLFSANFNGTNENGGYNADVATGSGVPIDKPSDGTAAPNDPSSTKSKLLADGVVFHSGDTQKLSYQSRISAMNQSENGNFPPIYTVSDLGNANKATLMFWFKLNRKWMKKNYWYTVFFANTHYVDAITGLDCGVQREIAMLVKTDYGNEEQEDPGKPLLRKVGITVRNKYYSYKGSSPRNPKKEDSSAVIPYDYLEHSREIWLDADDGYGVHAQEWYNIAVRWHNGTQMDRFGTYPGEGGDPYEDVGIVICGNYYSVDGNGNESLTQNGSGLEQKVMDSDVSVCNETIDPVGGIPPDENTNDKRFEVLSSLNGVTGKYEGFIQQNKFYLGYTGITSCPRMTIDDFRISPVVAGWIDGFQPSRFGEIKDHDNDDTDNDGQKDSDPDEEATQKCYGVYQAKIKCPEKGNLVCVYWVARKWENSQIRFERRYKKDDKQDDKKAYISSWENLWKDMTEDYNLNLISNNRTSSFWENSIKVYAKVKIKKEAPPPEVEEPGPDKYVKDLDIQFWKKPKSQPWQKWYHLKWSGYTTSYKQGTKEEKTMSFSYTPGEKGLSVVLYQWFTFMQSHGYYSDKTYIDDFLGKESSQGVTPGEPIVEGGEYCCKVMFPMSQDGALYTSPVVDDITMVYQPDVIQYEEYCDGSLLP